MFFHFICVIALSWLLFMPILSICELPFRFTHQIHPNAIWINGRNSSDISYLTYFPDDIVL